jgi:predicted transcriptional regulator
MPDAEQGSEADPAAGMPRLGALEQQVMQVLWDCPDELCTRDVLTQLTGPSLAYTTVATVLTNLARKGMVERVSVGRTWAYRPLHSRSAYAAGRMTQALGTGGDRAQSLLHFVQAMSPDDTALLRSLLDAPREPQHPSPAPEDGGHR